MIDDINSYSYASFSGELTSSEKIAIELQELLSSR